MEYFAIVFVVVVFIYIALLRKRGIEIESVDFSEAKNLLDRKEYKAIDVRRSGEIATGKIEGALEINVTSPSFREKIKALDKEQKYIVYCRSGKRSMMACKMMKNEGFKNVINLTGGFNNWLVNI